MRIANLRELAAWVLVSSLGSSWRLLPWISRAVLKIDINVDSGSGSNVQWNFNNSYSFVEKICSLVRYMIS